MNLTVMQRVMLAIAGAQESSRVLGQIVDGIAECRRVALARIWLLDSRAELGGPRMRLVASAGNLQTDPERASRLDEPFACFQLAEERIRAVVDSGEGSLIPDLRVLGDGVIDQEWIRSEEVVSFAAQPLITRGETVGALAVLDRMEIDDDSHRWLRTFADHAAVAIANARAFEEIEELRQRLEQDNQYLREEVTQSTGEMLGHSAAIEKVRQQIRLVAATGAGVLIHGESGVGKELVARAIHEASPRAERPLIKVNCGAIPGELFESEFFGHVQGAFTGAARDRVGRFELADGGTLFLDEVGEIPLEHQAKLLRVLQEGTFERVGDERTRSCDVRIIAATNRDLATESREGRFRSDLYYRLGVFPIEVPPLRDRAGDVALLAQRFVDAACRRWGRRATEVSEFDLERLERYGWPGNVRELQHVIERAVILAAGGPIRIPDLGGVSSLEGVDSGEERDAPKRDSDARAVRTLAELKQLERDIIAEAWEAAGRRVSGPQGAAKALGVPASTLESKLRAHGIKAARG